MQFDPGIRYQCLQCGKSCRQDWDVWVRPELPAQVRKRYREIFSTQSFPFEEVDGRWRMSRGEAGCVSLDSQSRCNIHSHLSYGEKPYRCQQYPVLLVRTPDGVRVTGSYTCTAVLQGHGPELAAQGTEIATWLERPFFVSDVGNDLPWEEARAQDHHFEELLRKTGWESALERILSGLVSGLRDSRTDHPVNWWKGYRALPIDLCSCLPWLLAALLKPCLRLVDKPGWEQFDLSMLNDGPIQLEEFAYHGSLSEMLEWATDRQSLCSDLDRYRYSLWFRQQHLRCGGVLSGWLMLWAVGPLYRVLKELCGSHGALERIELNLLGHTNLGEQVFPALARFWLDGQRQTVSS